MYRILVVGTVSNVASHLISDLKRLDESIGNFHKTEYFLVESDSRDRTLDILNDLGANRDGFRWKSLGSLAEFIPDRVERIRHCRNEYVNFIRENFNIHHWDFVVIADLDGMNKALSPSSFASCFDRNDWDVCLSNQKGGYYDIFALRHPTWQPENYFNELDLLRETLPRTSGLSIFIPKRFEISLREDRAKKIAIYKKMRKIPRGADWISVDSGFGGFAVYRPDVFIRFNYDKITEDLRDSEHIDLHLKIIESGGKIYINPNLINSNWNTYNINRFFIIRQLRRMMWNNSFVYDFYKKIKKLFSSHGS